MKTKSHITLFSFDGHISLPSNRSSIGAVTESISGTLKDPSGGVVPLAAVITTANALSGAQAKTTTRRKRLLFLLRACRSGLGDLSGKPRGFVRRIRRRVHIDADSALQVDMNLVVAEQNQELTVSESAGDVQLETISTQMSFETKNMLSRCFGGSSAVPWSQAGAIRQQHRRRVDQEVQVPPGARMGSAAIRREGHASRAGEREVWKSYKRARKRKLDPDHKADPDHQPWRFSGDWGVHRR